MRCTSRVASVTTCEMQFFHESEKDDPKTGNTSRNRAAKGSVRMKTVTHVLLLVAKVEHDGEAEYVQARVRRRQVDAQRASEEVERAPELVHVHLELQNIFYL